MIIVSLRGGLGNQLFQYAFGRRLAQERCVPLKLDLSWFNLQPDRKYRLVFFNIQAEILPQQQASWYNDMRLPYRIQRTIRRKLPTPFKYTQIKESQDQDVEHNIASCNVPGSMQLIGYWQSEKYFKPLGAAIRQELRVSVEPDTKNKEFLEKIKHGNAVSLHIRRGDYVTNPSFNAKHGVLPLTYYHNAVETIGNQVEDPHFYIFSDDHIWAQDNLNLSYPFTLVDINDAETDYEDLRLMTYCKHHIIANSSFSWWGAWLSSFDSKIVIAPSQWFQDLSVNARERVPDDWIRL